MSYLAAMLLLSLDTYQAFVALANLLHGYRYFYICMFVFILIALADLLHRYGFFCPFF